VKVGVVRVSAEVKIATAKEIRKAGLIIKVFKTFKVRVGFVKAGAETISIIQISIEVGIEVGIRVKIKVSAKVRINVSAEVTIITIKKIKRTRTGLIVKVFRGFKVKVRSSGKS
jgi:hypothetical protein